MHNKVVKAQLRNDPNQTKYGTIDSVVTRGHWYVPVHEEVKAQLGNDRNQASMTQ